MKMSSTGILLIAGGLAMLTAGADRLRVLIVQPEKDAVYAFGHWFDVPWEIDLPLFLLGAALALGAVLTPGRKR